MSSQRLEMKSQFQQVQKGWRVLALPDFWGNAEISGSYQSVPEDCRGRFVSLIRRCGDEELFLSVASKELKAGIETHPQCS